MNVSTLLANGYKISNVASLSTDELSELIMGLHDATSSDTICAAYIHDLSTAMVAFNEKSFDEVFDAAVKKMGFYDCMLNVVYPFLRKTGLMWRIDKSAPIQEHFASCIIRRKIIMATDALPLDAAKKKSFMLFLPPAEWHETGLLLANYLIRSKGYKTIYLGQNVPYDDIKVVMDNVAPDYMLTFYISPKPSEEIVTEISKLAKENKGVKILITGDSSLLGELNFNDKNSIYLKDIDALMNIL